MSAVNINEALRTTITLSRNEWKYCAELKTDFAPDMPLVPCLASELNQVFLNLLVNAAHAVEDAGRGEDTVKGIVIVSTRAGEDYVEIRIADNGKGIPAEIQGRIFEPFFTTKQVGRGTGQGLAIARAIIVEKHHGTIDFETTPGEGTVFIVKLPIAHADSFSGEETDE
jgi:signal transduction histidine kinase